MDTLKYCIKKLLHYTFILSLSFNGPHISHFLYLTVWMGLIHPIFFGPRLKGEPKTLQVCCINWGGEWGKVGKVVGRVSCSQSPVSRRLCRSTWWLAGVPWSSSYAVPATYFGYWWPCTLCNYICLLTPQQLSGVLMTQLMFCVASYLSVSQGFCYGRVILLVFSECQRFGYFLD